MKRLMLRICDQMRQPVRNTGQRMKNMMSKRMNVISYDRREVVKNVD